MPVWWRTTSCRFPRCLRSDYPIIQVTTFYPGASPEVMVNAVTSPLERQFGQIPGLQQMTSISSGGGSVITLEFSLAESIDVAQQDVQAAINAGYSYLPTDLPNPPVYAKVNPADAPILTLSLTSSTMPLEKVEDLADTMLAQKMSQLSGVGLVSIAGGQKPAVRIQANPTALASYGLSLEDIRSAIGTANVDQAKGSLSGPRQSYTMAPTINCFPQVITRTSSSRIATARRCAFRTLPTPSTLPRTSTRPRGWARRQCRRIPPRTRRAKRLTYLPRKPNWCRPSS